MAKLTLEEATLLIEQCPESSDTVSLSFTALRLMFLFLPPEHSLCIGGDAGPGIVDLEAITDDGWAEFTAQLHALEAKGASCTLFLMDYAGRYASISLEDIRDSGIALLEEVHRYRGERWGKLADWSKNMPSLIVVGLGGDKVTFGLDGVRASADQFLAWEGLERLDVRKGPAEEYTYCFITKQGVCGDGFSGRIPATKARVLLAECAFWRTLARRQAEDPQWRTHSAAS